MCQTDNRGDWWLIEQSQLQSEKKLTVVRRETGSSKKGKRVMVCVHIQVEVEKSLKSLCLHHCNLALVNESMLMSW